MDTSHQGLSRFDLQLPVQSVPITTKVVRGMFSLQHCLVFILDIFYVYFFVDCDEGLSSSSNIGI
jgi:hypothetical protein